MSGKLYVVGTPIGNLGDFSPRAIETLENVDFIAAEDTRVTLKLLNHFGIKKEMVSYFEHNKNERGEVIISRLANGETCAICTDAVCRQFLTRVRIWSDFATKTALRWRVFPDRQPLPRHLQFLV